MKQKGLSQTNSVYSEEILGKASGPPYVPTGSEPPDWPLLPKLRNVLIAS